MSFLGNSEPDIAGDGFETGAPFIVPLAIPLIVCPSTIAVLLLLNSKQPKQIMELGAYHAHK